MRKHGSTVFNLSNVSGCSKAALERTCGEDQIDKEEGSSRIKDASPLNGQRLVRYVCSPTLGRFLQTTNWFRTRFPWSSTNAATTAYPSDTTESAVLLCLSFHRMSYSEGVCGKSDIAEFSIIPPTTIFSYLIHQNYKLFL